MASNDDFQRLMERVAEAEARRRIAWEREILLMGEIASLRVTVGELEAEHARLRKRALDLRSRIVRFCAANRTAYEGWKQEPAVAPLFEVAGAECDLAGGNDAE